MCVSTKGIVFSMECQQIAPGTIGRMRKEILEFDYIETFPSVRNVPLASRHGARRDISLGQLSDGNTVSVSLSGEGQVGSAKTFPAVQHNIRALLHGILAAYSRPISVSAYGGTQAGVVRVPAESRQIRVQLCQNKADRLLWKILGLATSFGQDLNAYIDCCDAVMFEFAKHCEQMTMHPSDVIDYLIDQRPALFSPAEDVSSMSSGSGRSRSSAAPTAPAEAPIKGGKAGICSNWLQNGSCRGHREGTCVADHPVAQQGALKGGGQRYQPYQPYQSYNWDDWGYSNQGWEGGWGSRRPSKPKKGTQSKGKGGKGGKGNGTKGGKGGKWWW